MRPFEAAAYNLSIPRINVLLMRWVDSSDALHILVVLLVKKTRHGKEVSSMGVKCDSMTFNRIKRGDHIVVQIPGWMTKFALAQK